MRVRSVRPPAVGKRGVMMRVHRATANSAVARDRGGCMRWACLPLTGFQGSCVRFCGDAVGDGGATKGGGRPAKLIAPTQRTKAAALGLCARLASPVLSHAREVHAACGLGPERDVLNGDETRYLSSPRRWPRTLTGPSKATPPARRPTTPSCRERRPRPMWPTSCAVKTISEQHQLVFVFPDDCE